jgi:hypothetical protein
MSDSQERLEYLYNNVLIHYPQWITLARQDYKIFQEACIASANDAPDKVEKKLNMDVSTKRLKKLQKNMSPFVKSLGFKQPQYIMDRLYYNTVLMRITP